MTLIDFFQSNPWIIEKWDRPMPYASPVEEEGNNLLEGGVCYTLWCGEWGEGTAYSGKTGGNSYTRGLDHLLNALENRNGEKSVTRPHLE